MADSAVAEATEAVGKLHLDEVTGEMISKTELKKRQKKREKEGKKESKQPTEQTQKKTKSAEEDESNLTPNQV